jgi:hypothetical protein
VPVGMMAAMIVPEPEEFTRISPPNSASRSLMPASPMPDAAPSSNRCQLRRDHEAGLIAERKIQEPYFVEVAFWCFTSSSLTTCLTFGTAPAIFST